MFQTPPVPPHDFAYSAESITTVVEECIRRTRELEDKILKLGLDGYTFDTVVKPLAEKELRFINLTDPAVFMQSVSVDQKIRDAARKASKRLKEFDIECNTRKGVYEALEHVLHNTSPGSLDGPSQRLLERMLQDRRRAGLGLPVDKQAEFKELQSKITAICIEFNKNCDGEKGFLLFTKEELVGVPATALDSLEVVDHDSKKLYKVTHKTTDVWPIMNNAQNPDTRKKVYVSTENACALQNKALFEQLIDLRKKAAAAIGYD